MTLEEFADQHNLEITLTRIFPFDPVDKKTPSRISCWQCSLTNCWGKTNPLMQSRGYGISPKDALHDFIQKIKGDVLIRALDGKMPAVLRDYYTNLTGRNLIPEENISTNCQEIQVPEDLDDPTPFDLGLTVSEMKQYTAT